MSQKSAKKNNTLLQRQRNLKIYWNNLEASRLRPLVAYYRKKKAEGKDWIPKDYSKLYIICDQRGWDVIAVIEGTQSIKDVNQ